MSPSYTSSILAGGQGGRRVGRRVLGEGRRGRQVSSGSRKQQAQDEPAQGSVSHRCSSHTAARATVLPASQYGQPSPEADCVEVLAGLVCHQLGIHVPALALQAADGRRTAGRRKAGTVRGGAAGQRGIRKWRCRGRKGCCSSVLCGRAGHSRGLQAGSGRQRSAGRAAP